MSDEYYSAEAVEKYGIMLADYSVTQKRIKHIAIPPQDSGQTLIAIMDTGRRKNDASRWRVAMEVRSDEVMQTCMDFFRSDCSCIKFYVVADGKLGFCALRDPKHICEESTYDPANYRSR